MTSQLLYRIDRASGQQMARALISFAMMLSVLFGNVGGSAFASAHRDYPSVANQIAELACPDDNDSNGPAQQSDIPGEHHHHCGHGIAVLSPSVDQSVNIAKPLARPGLSALLASRSQAPLTEPPSA